MPRRLENNSNFSFAGADECSASRNKKEAVRSTNILGKPKRLQRKSSHTASASSMARKREKKRTKGFGWTIGNIDEIGITNIAVSPTVAIPEIPPQLFEQVQTLTFSTRGGI